MLTAQHLLALIDEAEYLIDNDVDGEGNPLTSETEFLIRKEISRLNFNLSNILS